MDLVGCPAGKTCFGPFGWLFDQPVIVAESKRGLSAGRVQSVTLRLIADRKVKLMPLFRKEYWSMEAKLSVLV